jgi:hypothetical protein
MEDTHTYRTLRFERRAHKVPRRLIAIGVAVAVITLLWIFVPPKTLYWLLLPFWLAIVWVASYGWRQALTSLIWFLKNLERF